MFQTFTVWNIHGISHSWYQPFMVSHIQAIKHSQYQIFTVLAIHSIKYSRYQTFNVSNIHSIEYYRHQTFTVLKQEEPRWWCDCWKHKKHKHKANLWAEPWDLVHRAWGNPSYQDTKTCVHLIRVILHGKTLDELLFAAASTSHATPQHATAVLI